MLLKISIPLFFVTALVFASEPTHEDHTPQAEENHGIRITESPDEIQVPGKIFDLLAVLNQKQNLVFAPVVLILKEKNPGILKQPEIRIEYPRGGGSLDLSQWLTGKQGSFFVRFEFEENLSHDGKKTFFVSRVRKRKVDNEILGAGCKIFMEIQKALDQSSSKGGLLVNTTHRRHLAVLGGSFIFSAIQGKDLRLSQISFTDRTQPQYFCDSTAKTQEKQSE